MIRENGSYVGLDDATRQKYLNRKADCQIEPFLKMLRVHDLIECDANPRKAKLKTRIKIQKFVYFAQKCFGLEFRYRHKLYIYGPYSSELATDYFRIKDIANIPDGGLDDWNRRDEFLEFAKTYNDETWLEIGGTLVYLYKSGHKSKERLIKNAHVVKRKYSKEHIESVCSDLQSAELINL